MHQVPSHCMDFMYTFVYMCVRVYVCACVRACVDSVWLDGYHHHLVMGFKVQGVRACAVT